MQTTSVILSVLLAFHWAADDDQAKAARQDLSQWVMKYYTKPTPEQFVARVRQLAELKLLHSNRPGANEMFLGKLMQGNPQLIAGWLDALSDLPADDAAVLHRAAWMSQTAEARQWLMAHGQAELAQKPAHPLLAGGNMVFEPHHLDLLWEWFFATGEEQPVRRIIGFFPLVSGDPVPGQLPSPPPANGDRFAQANFRVGGPAIWSTSSLAVQHDRVFEILQACEQDPKLPPKAKVWVSHVVQMARERREKPTGK